jgi:uncharacterized protein
MPGWLRRAIVGLVDFSGARPFVVLGAAFVVTVATWFFALKVLANPHTDLLELLPRDSPGFQAYEHQLGRVGGGATLIVVVDSPDRQANERYIDDLTTRLHGEMAAEDAAAKTGAPKLISYVESGTKEVRTFFENNKWLYADLEDLKNADETLDHQIAIQSGEVEDLLDDDSPKPAPKSPSASSVSPAPSPPPSPEKKPALGMDQFRDRWKAKAREHDDFPTGYFATPEGTMLGLRIISRTTGTGDVAGDALLALVTRMTEELGPSRYHPEMKVGFAGDIANAVAEKESIVSEVAWATGTAFLLVLAGVVLFYRSPWSLVVIAVPAILGVGCAYAFAYFRFGYVNTTGMFLGAIILGNGINYPIVLLSRYHEFRARGQPPAEARRDAVLNAFRAELVGACVGSIAYGSLTITRFRGFNQFGWIGFVGMLLVWVSMIPCVPALITVIERIQGKLPAWMRDPAPKLLADGSRGRVTRWISNATERAPWVFLGLAAIVAVVAAYKLPGFLHDPWEYNFDKLGSRGSKQGGAGEWSNKAEKVFGGKMNVAGARMLADSPAQVPLVKEAIFRNDAEDTQGRLVKEVATVADLLPGTDEEQKAKLAVLDSIRDRLTERVLYDMPPDERARVEEIRPPESLHVLRAAELPDLLRRRFEENDGRVGTVFYVKFWDFARQSDVIWSDGHVLLRIAKITDNVRLADGTVVQTASRSTIFAEMIRSMERDGPLATFMSFFAVMVVVVLATRNLKGAVAVLAALVLGVLYAVGIGALTGMKLNYVSFIALPITFGIGCEYPFNVYDRSRLLEGDVSTAVKRVGGAVALCSYTTVIGYSSLLFADTQALQSFGRLAVSGEIACLSGALLVVPSLLHAMRPAALRRNRWSPSTTANSSNRERIESRSLTSKSTSK